MSYVIYKTFPHSIMVDLARSYDGEKCTLHGKWNEKLEDFEPDEVYQVIVNEHYDNGRWKSQHDLVFLDMQTGKHYHVRYENGLTESQHYSPFDGENEIDCAEVEIKQEEVVTIKTTWESKCYKI